MSLPAAARQPVAGVDRDRVEQHAPHVVLLLVPGTVAGPHRAGALVAGEVVERLLGELVLAADPVHDLEGVGAYRLHDEGEELECLPLEVQREEAPEHEGGIADPGEAVVPVALAAGRLRQRRGGGGHDRPGGRVAQALERQRAALEVTPPGMVGEVAALQPVPPDLRRVPYLIGGLLRRAGDLVAPGERREGHLSLLEGRPRGYAGSGEAERHAAGQSKLQIPARRRYHGAVVPLAVVAPGPWLAPVVEDRQAVEDHLGGTVDTGGDAEQGPGCDEVARGALVVLVPLAAVPAVHDEAVVDLEPARRRLPRRLQDEAAGEVPAVAWHLDALRQEAEDAGGPVEHRAEHARRVRARQAEPLDPASRCDQGAGLAVREKCVVGDRWEVAAGGAGLGLGVPCGRRVKSGRLGGHESLVGRRPAR